MRAQRSEQKLYARAGIKDVAEFYREKFVSNAVLEHRYFKALDRFDLRFARTMWVYDNVRPNSAILDLGCGAGMLALLKRKSVDLTGVDLSDECVGAALRALPEQRRIPQPSRWLRAPVRGRFSGVFARPFFRRTTRVRHGDGLRFWKNLRPECPAAEQWSLHVSQGFERAAWFIL